jgi:hypothetical protein
MLESNGAPMPAGGVSGARVPSNIRIEHID